MKRLDEPISLGLPELDGKTVEDPLKAAEVLSIQGDIAARKLMVRVMAGIFIGLNLAVMVFVGFAFYADLSQPPTARIVTTGVLMSLIGATVVQVGVATISIVGYLFPKSSVQGGASKPPARKKRGETEPTT